MKDARLDRFPAHEGDVGAGLADLPETRHDLFATVEDFPGAIGIPAAADHQIRRMVSRMPVQKFTAIPFDDSQQAGGQDRAAAIGAGLDQQGDLEGSRRAADLADHVMFFQPGLPCPPVAGNQPDLGASVPAALQNPFGLGIRAGVEVSFSRQWRASPGTHGSPVFFVAAERAEIIGADGMLEIPDTYLDNAGSLRLLTKEGEQEISVPSSDRFGAEFADFSAAILHGRAPKVSLAESLHNAQIMDLLQAAAR